MKPEVVRAIRWVVAFLALFIALCVLVARLNVRGESPLEPQASSPAPASAAIIDRGAYLARAGNCAGCHTTTGGSAYAGGRGIETSFGTVFASNITPDDATGIGRWSPAEFWRAMHHGRSKDGRLLYPAFPYTSFTQVTREDSDALYAFLRSVAPVERANKPHALGFPYGTQAALAVWRALYFKPGNFEPDTELSPTWNRGRYLVEGLGHCSACHSGRNRLGATSADSLYGGGPMPDAAWYAPSLSNPKAAGVQGWPREEIVRLLKHGVSSNASVSGPMAEVVFDSTQHLRDDDLDAMALYLASLPTKESPTVEVKVADSDVKTRGARLYGDHCASCHGDQGQGVRGIYPALAGNRAVTLAAPHNLVQTIRHGGFAPTTAGNPRPFGMPPFGQALDDNEVSAVATYIRQSWGNTAAPVSALDVLRIK
jgi:mono/diheme cytochrome c family protein